MIPEILGDGGVLVPPADVTQLARGIHSLLDDSRHAAALGQRARARCIATYSFTAARARLFPLIDQIAAQYPGSGVSRA
jgi:glycosyltransferase involved in cell wall biosynthesis